MQRARWTSVLILLPLLWLTACSPQPKPIAYGEENCTHCLMSISDNRYAAELVTKKGKVYTFDSIECMASYIRDTEGIESQIHSLYVTDFQNPAELIPIEEATFLHSPNLRSPMGLNVTAFGSHITREAITNSFAGELLSWDGVVQLAAEHAGPGGHGAMHPAEMN